ncbi:hypothetical protein P7K49_032523 [Saguinus oedipus]|uniref:Uncharacterized protein n=1 Tax=Saguinus oedipus TaxID=9490 RepID=A0ABQ9U0D3_SAGOE|nr:hypothetical protein P7K49_032523 [Saguinus oedipus]
MGRAANRHQASRTAGSCGRRDHVGGGDVRADMSPPWQERPSSTPTAVMAQRLATLQGTMSTGLDVQGGLQREARHVVLSPPHAQPVFLSEAHRPQGTSRNATGLPQAPELGVSFCLSQEFDRDAHLL